MNKEEIRKKYSEAFEFEGKIAYIPGGYGDLGKGAAWGLAVRGAKVAISGRNAKKAEQAAAELTEAGYEAIGFRSDSSQVAEIKNAARVIKDKLGVPDILVNSVGISLLATIFEMDEETFDAVYQANLRSAMFLDQVVGKMMVDAGIKGRIIHLTSVRSLLALPVTYPGMGHSAYVATKGGLAMLMKQHASELAPYGITVNAVAPTLIDSAMMRGTLSGSGDKLVDDYKKRIPLGRIGDISDVAGAILYFSSNIASFVTGQTLFVDGGLTAVQ